MPRPKNKSRHPNLLRNDYMCELAMKTNAAKARLIGFPGSPFEQQRSGTWACIRSARAAGIPRIDLYPLSSAIGMTDGGQFPGVGNDPDAYWKHGRIVHGDD